MLHIQSQKLAGLAVTAALLATPAPAMACGYHGMLGNGFSVQHARSMDVALAVRDAADAGVVNPDQLKPKLADMLALHRASQRLEQLRQALQQVAGDALPPPFALLLVESGMWNSFFVEAGAVRLAAHVDGPPLGSAVVVTGDAVLAAMAAGKLSPDDAFRLGLIVVDGPPELARTLAAGLGALRGDRQSFGSAGQVNEAPVKELVRH